MTNSFSAEIDNEAVEPSEAQVAAYLLKHSDFFLKQEEVLAELTLPHKSGKAISLLERQVAILRNRGIDARKKLGTLLDNASTNDHLFDATRNLVLALLKAEQVGEVINIVQDQLSDYANIDVCEIFVVEDMDYKLPDSIHARSAQQLKQDFDDLYRLKRTHCGALGADKIASVFSSSASHIKSTALCPAIYNDEILAVIALGNNNDNYFNANLDTLFLDFIGQVLGATLNRYRSKSV